MYLLNAYIRLLNIFLSENHSYMLSYVQLAKSYIAYSYMFSGCTTKLLKGSRLSPWGTKIQNLLGTFKHIIYLYFKIQIVKIKFRQNILGGGGSANFFAAFCPYSTFFGYASLPITCFMSLFFFFSFVLFEILLSFCVLNICTRIQCRSLLPVAKLAWYMQHLFVIKLIIIIIRAQCG